MPSFQVQQMQLLPEQDQGSNSGF